MGYNILDIIDKAIKIENKKKAIIKNVVADDNVIPAIVLMPKVLCHQMDEIIKYYEELKTEIMNTEFEEIDIRTYDKISFLMNEFNDKIYTQDIQNGKDYLKLSLKFAKDKYSLFLDIQGRLVKDMDDTNTKTYEILSKMIKNIKKQIQTIEKTII